MKDIKILDVEEDYIAYKKNGDIKFVDFEIEYFTPVMEINEKSSFLTKEPKNVNILSFHEFDSEVKISNEFKKDLEKLVWENIHTIECSQEELELFENIKNKRYLYEI